jgi:replicative DNA helicase
MNTPTLPPYSDEAERSLVGSCIIDQSAILRVMSEVEPGDFFIERNRWVYDAVISLYRAGRQIDFQTVNIQLANQHHLDEVGGPAFVMELVNSVPTAIHAESYAQIVKRKAIRRKMLDSATTLARMAYEEDADEFEQLSLARTSIASIAMPSNHAETAGQVANRVYAQAVDAYEHPIGPDEVHGIATGLIDFDKLLGGITPKKLIVLAGRPGMNKSTLACQVAFMAAHKSGARCAIFSLEMTNDEVMRRQYSRITGIPHADIEEGRVSDWDAMTQAGTALDVGVLVDDNPSATAGYIESVILKHGPFDLVVVDHLGLMSEVQHCNPASMVHTVGRTARAFKTMSKDYNTCVMLVSQLSRKVEERADKRPLLSDLRDSGNIEEHADEVYGLYRDDYYNTDSTTPNICEVIRRKGRNKAQRMSCDLYFDGPTISLKSAVHRMVAL